jgi:hypothetical protein
MQAPKKRLSFFESQEAKDIREELQTMIASDLYNTASSYTTDTSSYPDNLMPFADKHMNYLYTHPSLDATVYLANVRLKTRDRTVNVS